MASGLSLPVGADVLARAESGPRSARGSTGNHSLIYQSSTVLLMFGLSLVKRQFGCTESD
jgi:hypothetical protein